MYQQAVRELDYDNDLPLAMNIRGLPHLFEMFPRLRDCRGPSCWASRDPGDAVEQYYVSTEEITPSIIRDCTFSSAAPLPTASWAQWYHVKIDYDEGEDWSASDQTILSTHLASPDALINKVNISRIEICVEVDLSCLIGFLHIRKEQSLPAIRVIDGMYGNYDLHSVNRLLDIIQADPARLSIGAPYRTSTCITLVDLFTGITWAKYTRLAEFNIEVEVPRIGDKTQHPDVCPLACYGGQSIPLQEFTIAFHNVHLDEVDSFDYSKYALPPMSQLAAAMLSVGGPECKYLVDFIHPPGIESTNLREIASGIFTNMLRMEVQAILSREPAEKGWRKLDVAERLSAINENGRRGEE
jgi:hypothetical protein